MARQSFEENYFSDGFRNFLRIIAPVRGQRPATRYFPENLHGGIAIDKNQSIHAWFKHVVDCKLEGKLEQIQLEENMAVLARVCYDNKGKEIKYANIQAIIVESDLATLYCDENTLCHYFRLEYDLGGLGKMFDHPQPHIHTVPDGAPRFSGLLSKSGNIVVDFFDFLYRNFYHSKWQEWARTAYVRSGQAFWGPYETNSFEAISDRFGNSRYSDLITVHKAELSNIKAACKSEKDRSFAPRIDAEIMQLTYDV